MELPNSTKKRETRATLNTCKIMSLIKREMKSQDIRLGKIGDHICTNRRIKLRGNRRNIEMYDVLHKLKINPRLNTPRYYIKLPFRTLCLISEFYIIFEVLKKEMIKGDRKGGT
jgi:hypothetical protein